MLAPLTVTTQAAEQAELNQPNVILMMADDLGWGDTGYNGNQIIHTRILISLPQREMVIEVVMQNISPHPGCMAFKLVFQQNQKCQLMIRCLLQSK